MRKVIGFLDADEADGSTTVAERDKFLSEDAAPGSRGTSGRGRNSTARTLSALRGVPPLNARRT